MNGVDRADARQGELPTLEPSATTITRRARPIRARLVVRLDLVVGGQAALDGDAVDADEGEVEVEAFERALGQRTD